MQQPNKQTIVDLGTRAVIITAAIYYRARETTSGKGGLQNTYFGNIISGETVNKISCSRTNTIFIAMNGTKIAVATHTKLL